MKLHLMVRVMTEPDAFRHYHLDVGQTLTISDGREVVVATVSIMDEKVVRLDMYPEESRVPDFVPESLG